MFNDEFQRMEQIVPTDKALYLLEDLMGKAAEPRTEFIFENVDFSMVRE